MKKIVVFLLFFATVFCLLADEDEKSKLAVMEFEDLSGKLSKNMLSRATELIRSKFVSSNKFIVIAKERQEKAMISEMKKESYKACNDKNCQIPLGQALSADTILRTTITFFGGTYTITSELIDLEKEATTQGAEATFDGTEKSLKEAISSIVTQIAGKEKQKEIKPKDSQDEIACNYAKQEASIPVWSQYLEDFPNGGCADLAHEEVDKMACEHAEKNKSIEAWELYLKHQAKGKCAFKAKAEIRKLKKEIERAEEWLKGRKIGSLIWSDRSLSKMNWNSAKEYCENLSEGGYTDWRLPNIDELRTTIKNCYKTEIGGECRVSERNSCLSWKQCGNGYRNGSCYCDDRNNNGGYYSKLGDPDGAYLWSSSTRSDSTDSAWGVLFTNGIVSISYKSYNFYVRCVR
ncbi:DUF1566 domain-containing protein [bacterium]|nr:DUF1566 domain-containing protein [bacterium]